MIALGKYSASVITGYRSSSIGFYRVAEVEIGFDSIAANNFMMPLFYFSRVVKPKEPSRDGVSGSDSLRVTTNDTSDSWRILGMAVHRGVGGGGLL